MKTQLSPALLTECRLEGQRLAEAVKLPLLRKIWRGASGDFAGAGTGNSMEFQDHRAYQAGDDPRHLNWQAYARTGQFTMKVFRQEVRPLAGTGPLTIPLVNIGLFEIHFPSKQYFLGVLNTAKTMTVKILQIITTMGGLTSITPEHISHFERFVETCD